MKESFSYNFKIWIGEFVLLAETLVCVLSFSMIKYNWYLKYLTYIMDIETDKRKKKDE